jgi:HlyD family secretion protein
VEAARAALLDPADVIDGSARVLRLHSPVDGVTLRRVRESAAVVAAGEPIVEVADTSELEIISDYLSPDAVRIQPGMPVIIARWGGDTPLNGTVRTVEPHGFLKVSALGVEEQRVWVVTDLTSPRELWSGLGDGYRVETQVVLWSSGDVLQVPTAALFRAPSGSWAAFIVRDGTAHRQAVEIGHRNGLSAEVIDGLAEGDTVILHPPDGLGDGARVRARG